MRRPRRNHRKLKPLKVGLFCVFSANVQLERVLQVAESLYPKARNKELHLLYLYHERQVLHNVAVKGWDVKKEGICVKMSGDRVQQDDVDRMHHSMKAWLQQSHGCMSNLIIFTTNLEASFVRSHGLALGFRKDDEKRNQVRILWLGAEKCPFERLPDWQAIRPELFEDTQCSLKCFPPAKRVMYHQIADVFRDAPLLPYSREHRSIRLPDLPISRIRTEIVEAVTNHRVTLLRSGTGTGKSTYVPIFLWEDAERSGQDCRVIVVQPKRMGATSIARRVEELVRHTNLRGRTAHKIGMDHQDTPSTVITFCTVGVLLRLISKGRYHLYTHILIDEIHERTWEMDLAIALLRSSVRSSTCKIVLMSATMDDSLLTYWKDAFPQGDSEVTLVEMAQQPGKYTYTVEALDGIPMFRTAVDLERGFQEIAGLEQSSGMHVVCPRVVAAYRKAGLLSLISEMVTMSGGQLTEESAGHMIEDSLGKYLAQTAKPVDLPTFKSLTAVVTQDILTHDIRIRCMCQMVKFLVADDTNKGDIIVFLPGLAQIAYCERELTGLGIEIIRLHSRFQKKAETGEQSASGRRRVYLSTNTAECSVTIKDLAFVLDSCMVKRSVCKSTEELVSGSNVVQTMRATKDVLKQRAGRTGRCCDGKVYQFFGSWEIEQMPDFREPETSSMLLDMLLLKVLTAKVVDGYEEIIRLLPGIGDTAKEMGNNLWSHEYIQKAAYSLFVKRILYREDTGLSLTTFGKLVDALLVDHTLARVVAISCFFAPEITVACAQAVAFATVLETVDCFVDRCEVNPDREIFSVTLTNGTLNDPIAYVNATRLYLAIKSTCREEEEFHSKCNVYYLDPAGLDLVVSKYQEILKALQREGLGLGLLAEAEIIKRKPLDPVSSRLVSFLWAGACINNGLYVTSNAVRSDSTAPKEHVREMRITSNLVRAQVKLGREKDLFVSVAKILQPAVGRGGVLQVEKKDQYPDHPDLFEVEVMLKSVKLGFEWCHGTPAPPVWDVSPAVWLAEKFAASRSATPDASLIWLKGTAVDRKAPDDPEARCPPYIALHPLHNTNTVEKVYALTSFAAPFLPPEMKYHHRPGFFSHMVVFPALERCFTTYSNEQKTTSAVFSTVTVVPRQPGTLEVLVLLFSDCAIRNCWTDEDCEFADLDTTNDVSIGVFPIIQAKELMGILREHVPPEAVAYMKELREFLQLQHLQPGFKDSAGKVDEAKLNNILDAFLPLPKEDKLLTKAFNYLYASTRLACRPHWDVPFLDVPGSFGD